MFQMGLGMRLLLDVSWVSVSYDLKAWERHWSAPSLVWPGQSASYSLCMQTVSA